MTAFFNVELILIKLFGADMAYLQRVAFEGVAKWDHKTASPSAARIAGALLLAF